MFHYFCGIYFRYRKVVLPIAMFTDPAKWKKNLESKFVISLPGHSVCEFRYNLIKLKNYEAEEFGKRIGENPLAAGYLPLTDYPAEDRPLIKAKAMKGIAKLPPGQGQATLFSLIQESLPLTTEEEKEFRKLVTDNPMYQEVKMLQSIEEVGIEKGLEKGLEQGLEKGRIQASEEIAKNLLGLGKLTIKEIGEITGLDMRRIEQLRNLSESC
jgi:predicted transposase/invertase (TIGR01784 family)